jgi:2-hydroxychromene-2-carboxylate isomerase
MSAVTFYFDPACPFAWAASRWLVNTAQRRDIEIDWRQMSLAVLNEGTDVPEQQRHHIEVSQQLGRVLAAAHDRAGDSALGPLYTALGQRVHQQGADVTAAMVAQALTESGLDPQLADSLDDSTYDSAVRVAHQQSQDSLGDSGGSPIVCIDGHCFFGPVLTAIPDDHDGDQLFDALQTLSATSAFAQLQRPHSGPPTFSS